LPGPGAIYMQQTLNFKAPVRIGDTVIARVEVTELSEKRPPAEAALHLRGGRHHRAGRRSAGEGADARRGRQEQARPRLRPFAGWSLCFPQAPPCLRLLTRWRFCWTQNLALPQGGE
jgi:hypothetical protein